MIYLKQARQSWNSPAFADEIKLELEQLTAEQLPLQQGLSHSSYVSKEPFKVMVISVTDEGATIRVKVGIFYTGIIAGCSCSDDPGPTDVQQEYCDLLLDIDKSTAATAITLIS
jgi:hypothetical protein